MEIQFQFHPEKAVEAAAILLKLHGKPMQNIGLLKMLYIADRVALKQMDQPITGDRYVSMDYGPVLSGVDDLIKGNPVDEALPIWTKFISSRDSDCVRLLADPGNRELCEEEEEILQQVYKKFGQLDPLDVKEWTHNLPEWKNYNGFRTVILVEDILGNIGKSDKEIEAIRQDALREVYLDKTLHSEYSLNSSQVDLSKVILQKHKILQELEIRETQLQELKMLETQLQNIKTQLQLERSAEMIRLQMKMEEEVKRRMNLLNPKTI